MQCCSLRQAAANLSFRLGGWLHLWKGFIGEEGWDMLVILSCFDASDQDRLLCHRVITSYNAIGMENQLDRSLKSCLGSDGTLSVSFLALSKEPFPLLEGRLSALCQQLGESVGMLSNHTVEQHQVNQSQLKCLRRLQGYCIQISLSFDGPGRKHSRWSQRQGWPPLK